MDSQIFLDEFLELLQRDEPVSLETLLSDIAEWDSLAIMSVAAFASARFSIRLTIDDFKKMQKVADIAATLGVAK